MKILLERRADVNAQGGFYGNALQAASFGGPLEIEQVLLEKGAIESSPSDSSVCYEADDSAL